MSINLTVFPMSSGASWFLLWSERGKVAGKTEVSRVVNRE